MEAGIPLGLDGFNFQDAPNKTVVLHCTVPAILCRRDSVWIPRKATQKIMPKVIIFEQRTARNSKQRESLRAVFLVIAGHTAGGFGESGGRQS